MGSAPPYVTRARPGLPLSGYRGQDHGAAEYVGLAGPRGDAVAGDRGPRVRKTGLGVGRFGGIPVVRRCRRECAKSGHSTTVVRRIATTPASAPASCTTMNVRPSIGPIPEKLFVYARAIVTAGLVQKPIIVLSVRKDSRGQAWPRAATRPSCEPIEKLHSRACIGAAGVRVADVGR
jgi:hypothetical protein